MNLLRLLSAIPVLALPMSGRVPEPHILTPGQRDAPWALNVGPLREACHCPEKPAFRLVELESAQ